MKVYAQVTKDGTAASETALCEEHISHRDEFYADDTTGELVDCSGNEALSCQWCGYSQHDPMWRNAQRTS